MSSGKMRQYDDSDALLLTSDPDHVKRAIVRFLRILRRPEPLIIPGVHVRLNRTPYLARLVSEGRYVEEDPTSKRVDHLSEVFSDIRKALEIIDITRDSIRRTQQSSDFEVILTPDALEILCNRMRDDIMADFKVQAKIWGAPSEEWLADPRLMSTNVVKLNDLYGIGRERALADLNKDIASFENGILSPAGQVLLANGLLACARGPMPEIRSFGRRFNLPLQGTILAKTLILSRVADYELLGMTTYPNEPEPPQNHLRVGIHNMGPRFAKPGNIMKVGYFYLRETKIQKCPELA